MRRRLFANLSVLSLVLCVATGALWVRSSWRKIDSVVYGLRGGRLLQLGSGGGGFSLTAWGPWPNDQSLEWHPWERPPNVWHFESFPYEPFNDPEPTRFAKYVMTWRDRGYLFLGADGTARWTKDALPPALTLRQGQALGSAVPGTAVITRRGVSVPHGAVAAVTGVLPCLWLPGAALRLRRRRVARAGRLLCPSCGYDLRVNPFRCPECGAEPKWINRGRRGHR
jgi:hypothetical protein